MTGADSVDAVVVGGGVAGLSAALHLAGDRSVRLLEAEPGLCAHASGRNAAIFRPLEEDATTAALTARSVELVRGWLGSMPLTLTGVLLAGCSEAVVATTHAAGRARGVECELVSAEAARALAPALEGGEVTGGVLLPGGGVLDIHALTEGLAAEARRRDAQLAVGVRVRSLIRRGNAVQGVELADGGRVAAGLVVLAAGAWNAAFGAAAGAPLPLVPLRRHLVMLDGGLLSAAEPVVWCLDDEVYFRPEVGGVLASPCDEERFEPGEPPVDAAALERLSGKLSRIAPGLTGLGVRRAWACLRTFAPDRELCIGLDPRLSGLCWFGGLGGRGMGVAPAAGELLAARVRGDDHALSSVVSPGRLI